MTQLVLNQTATNCTQHETAYYFYIESDVNLPIYDINNMLYVTNSNFSILHVPIKM